MLELVKANLLVVFGASWKGGGSMLDCGLCVERGGWLEVSWRD